jgi:hypothetical protein
VRLVDDIVSLPVSPDTWPGAVATWVSAHRAVGEQVFVGYHGLADVANTCSISGLTANRRSWFAEGVIEQLFAEQLF